MKNKKCWAKGCNKEQIKDSWYCKKHDKEEYVDVDVPMVKNLGGEAGAFRNTSAWTSPEEVKEKNLKQSSKNLDQAVRTGKAHGKNINNLRSKMKNGQWHYEYIK